MKVLNVLDSKIIQVGTNMYEAHIFIEYKTIFGGVKTKWIQLENELWAGNLSYFDSIELAKEAIKFYILQHKPEKCEVVFQGIPK